MTYEQLLESKVKRHIDSGFEANELHPSLFPFQKYAVKKALKAGRYCIWFDCGMGKTLIQLVWADEVAKNTNTPVLILAPLSVVGQTIEQADKFGISIKEYDGICESGIYISNYEQLPNINASLFAGVVLDEASIIKNEEGAYRNLVMDNFANTRYKLCCTATPSPNDAMELGNYSEFVGQMSRAEMLAMHFVHDGGETSKWRLKGHCEQLFWDWVSQWATMASKPSDLGFSDEGYNLPALNVIEKMITTEKKDNGLLFNDVAVSATNFNGELRLTKIPRIKEVVKIVNASTESFIIWIRHNDEGDMLRKLIPDAVEVKGSDTPEYKKSKLLGFGKNEFRVLITKVKIAGFGMNYQNTHNMIFASPDFSFEGIYQALRRQLRFGQVNEVNAWIITTDTMENVINAFYTKKEQHEKMQLAMKNAINKNLDKKIRMERQFEEYKSEFCHVKLGDSVQLIKDIPDESIGFSIFSPPFAELYTYSDELEDMGNSKDYNEFLIAFKFLIKDLYRILWSGRNVAVHCMDLPIQKGKEGYIGLRDFSGMIRQAFEEVGFIYHSRVTIWKNPVTEMQRTKALGLLHKQVKKDASMSRVGIPDYLLVFRKDGEHKHPVKCDISVDTWQQYASPVWMDIDYGDTLNAREARDEKDEKHICPLQLPTIERSIALWSNKGDKVFTPFMGVGSEVYKSIQMGRYGVGIELKKSYFDASIKNLKSAELSKTQATLL